MAVQTRIGPVVFPHGGTGRVGHPRAAHLPSVVMSVTILAHQGGWDEALVVAVPIALFALILWGANRRAARLQAERDGAPSDAD